MTKLGLQAELKKAGIKGWNSKTPKAQLESLLKGAVDSATTVISKSAPTKTTTKKAKEGVKTILYRLFKENPKLVIKEDDLLKEHLPGRKVASIRTWIGKGGLGSPTYGMVIDGKVDPIMITRNKETGELSRVA